MRVVHFLLLLTGVAVTAAGCAQQPMYTAYPQGAAPYPAGYPAPTAYQPPPSQARAGYPAAVTYPAPAAGIDHVVYGTGGPYVPPPPARAPIAPAPAAAMVPAAPAPMPVRVASAEPMAPLAVAPPPPAPASAAPPTRVASAVPVAEVAGPVVPVPAGVAYAPAVAPPEYTLDSGDRLRVVVFGQEGLTNAYLVDAAGLIDVPLIGQVMARGATTIELAHRIAAKLRNGFIREPHVAVEVVAYRPFFILGEVTAPGQYPYVPRMTAETAVAIAGGFTPRAFRRNLTVDRPVAGRIVRMSVPPSFPLHPGDTVNVQERWF
jgi:polysaccharide biosynthesis/export protein